MSVGGAVAGGARVALAARQPTTRSTFWDEVRRYGATVASYTWTMLAWARQRAAPARRAPPPDPAVHRLRACRAGCGGGCSERFAPARVLEFYASTETGAILVNLSAAPRPARWGARCRAAPEVRLAAYDPVADQLELGHGGFVRECRTRRDRDAARPRHAGATRSPRPRCAACSARDDAWLSTGDLFRRDADGDYWRLDSARELILTPRGPVYAGTVRDALGDLAEVDLVAVFGLRIGRRREELAVAAVSLREDRAPEARSVTTALGALPAGARPDVVRVVESIPVTTWFRPMTGPLREQGLPDPAAPGALPSWYLDRGGERYRPLTSSARRRLASVA